MYHTNQMSQDIYFDCESCLSMPYEIARVVILTLKENDPLFWTLVVTYNICSHPSKSNILTTSFSASSLLKNVKCDHVI